MLGPNLRLLHHGGPTAAIVMATAVGAGILVSFLSTGEILLLLAVPGAVVFCIVTRALFGVKAIHDAPAPREREIIGNRSAFSNRAAEWFFYAGTLTLGFPALRIGWATLSDLTYLLALLVSLSQFRNSERARLPGMLVFGTALYAAGALIASAASLRPVESLTVLARFVYLILIWFLLARRLLSDARRLKRAVVIWTASAALSGSAALLQAFGMLDFWTEINFYGRMTGFTEHPNDLGGITGIALLPALVLASREQESWSVRFFSFLAVALLAIGLLLSGSIGGFTAAFVAAAAWLSMVDTRLAVNTVPLLAVAAAILIICTAIGFGDSSPIGRLADVIGPDGSRGVTLSAREDTNRAALDWLNKDPLVGAGLDPSSRYTTTGMEVHNLVLGAWFTAGLMGFIGMVVILFSLLLASRSLMTASPRSQHGFFASLVSSLLGSLAFSMSAPIIHQRYAWIAAALVLAAGAQFEAPSGPSPRPAPHAGSVRSSAT